MHNPFITKRDRELIQAMADLAAKESELNNLVAREVILIRREIMFQNLVLASMVALFAFVLYKVTRP